MLRPPRARFTPPLLLQTHSPRRAQPCTHIPPRRPSLDRVPRGRGMRACAQHTAPACRFSFPSAPSIGKGFREAGDVAVKAVALRLART